MADASRTKRDREAGSDDIPSTGKGKQGKGSAADSGVTFHENDAHEVYAEVGGALTFGQRKN